ncbi:hypothetical protein [Bacillus sp. 03113]|uniref:hypothetical protein n=1 Tax=Bacillus sp. 03113 TaxID=2578211 RepID=UPI0011444D7A|nr:hypothetical protein [Bacillus sp. 03113]
MFNEGDWVINIKSGSFGYIEEISSSGLFVTVVLTRSINGESMNSKKSGSVIEFKSAPIYGLFGNGVLECPIDLAIDTKDYEWFKELLDHRLIIERV